MLGAPGEAMPDLTIRVTDVGGVPIAGAMVDWTVEGQGARVVASQVETDAAGAAQTGWVLGTNAAEVQQLHVSVRMPGNETQLVVQAQAVAHIVTQLRVALDTPAVLRLGDTLPISVKAIDPYGDSPPVMFPRGFAIGVGRGVIGAGAAAQGPYG
jgi:hypothetical protein